MAEAKKLGKGVNAVKADASLKERELLYNESRSSDVLGLRPTTPQERLKVLAASEEKTGIGN